MVEPRQPLKADSQVHPECRRYLRRFFTLKSIDVIEIGSRDINGSARAFFPNAKWLGLDLSAGVGVDIICDAADYSPERTVDLVVCCEVLEHCERWKELIERAAEWLKPNGRIIITCAGPGREAHSAIDGGPLHPDEHYANISQGELKEALEFATFGHIEVSGNEYCKDTYAIAWKQGPS